MAAGAVLVTVVAIFVTVAAAVAAVAAVAVAVAVEVAVAAAVAAVVTVVEAEVVVMVSVGVGGGAGCVPRSLSATGVEFEPSKNRVDSRQTMMKKTMSALAVSKLRSAMVPGGPRGVLTKACGASGRKISTQTGCILGKNLLLLVLSTIGQKSTYLNLSNPIIKPV